MKAESEKPKGQIETPHIPEKLRTPTQWVVITGAPSSGKTTIVNRLVPYLPNFTLVPEVAREIILSDINEGNIPDMSPGYNNELNKRVSAKRKVLEATIDPEKPTLMDRGTHDIQAFARYFGVDESYIDTEKKYKDVFMMTPLPYQIDEGRLADPELVAKMDSILLRVYREHGYQPIRVSQFPYGETSFQTEAERIEASIDQRTRFILEHMGIKGK